MTQKHRLKLTSRERHEVAEAFLEASALHPGSPWLTRFRAANSVLPPERQLKVNKICAKAIKWLEPMCAEVKRGREYLNAEASRPIAPAAQESAVAQHQHKHDVPPELSPLQSVVEHFTESVIDILTQRISNDVCNAINAALTRLETASVGKQSANGFAAPTAGRKPRIVVVGPLPRQATLLHAEFDAVFDLRIPDKGASSPVLRSLCGGAQRVIGWIDFLSHPQDALLKAEAGAKYEQFRGGMESLSARLTEIYITQPNPKENQ